VLRNLKGWCANDCPRDGSVRALYRLAIAGYRRRRWILRMCEGVVMAAGRRQVAGNDDANPAALKTDGGFAGERCFTVMQTI